MSFPKKVPGKWHPEDVLNLLFVYKSNGDTTKKNVQAWENLGVLHLHIYKPVWMCLHVLKTEDFNKWDPIKWHSEDIPCFTSMYKINGGITKKHLNPTMEKQMEILDLQHLQTCVRVVFIIQFQTKDLLLKHKEQ